MGRDSTPEESPSIRKRGYRAKKRQEIKLANKFTPQFWSDVDARLSVVKLIKRRYELLRADAGGEESTQRDLLCRRATFLSNILETMETEATESGTLDISTYTQSLKALNGCLKALGLPSPNQLKHEPSGYRTSIRPKSMHRPPPTGPLCDPGTGKS